MESILDFFVLKTSEIPLKTEDKMPSFTEKFCNGISSGDYRYYAGFLWSTGTYPATEYSTPNPD
jgi:hypothetical protein